MPPPRIEQEPEPEPESTVSDRPAPQAGSDPVPAPEPKPEPVERAAEAPAPVPRPEPEPQTLPAGGNRDWPAPTDEQVQGTREPRRYDLPSGAALGLSVPAIGLHDVPVLRSNTRSALDRGVVHARGTSMPWSPTPERNVYMAGHRLGWPGTGSHLIFYRLNELGKGDQVTLKGPDGRRYLYRVTESFVVGPDDTWVMGRVRGRDMLTLQTCTPIPGFQKRLIVRAERL